MSIWKPELGPTESPLYLALADALARDVESGRLPPGARLPTHRELARALGMNVGTVTRAYTEAARRGLLDGEVGRGSFVRHPGARGFGSTAPVATPPELIDFAFNLPAGGPSEEELRSTLARLSAQPEIARLFASYHPAGRGEHREAGARWMRRAGVDASADRTLILGGAQHGMAVALATLTQPGDAVLCESLTYPGLRALAKLFGLRLNAVATDQLGLDPAALDAATRSGAAKVIYLMPNLHNPTGSILSGERRREVVRIARERGISIVEDDSFGFLCWSERAHPPALAMLAPERTYHIASLSKSVSAGLRVAYLLAPTEPDGIVERLLAASNAIAWMAAPLMAELAAQWIDDGTADRVVREKRGESRARNAIARKLLPGVRTVSAESSCHLWLELPDPWRSGELVARCRRRGVAVTPPEPFAVGRANAPHAVRVCLGTPASRADFERGLHTLAEVLRDSPESGASIV